MDQNTQIDRNAPIGILDSGMGGLTVWREVVQRLPNESVIYYGDGGNCPYGNRSKAEIIQLVDRIVQFFRTEGCKLIVLACNAATAAAVTHLRQTYPEIPFVGMEPAVKPAALDSRSGVIGILATAATLDGTLFRTTAERFSNRVEVLSRVGEGFVELVEEDRENTPEAYEAVANIVEPMLVRGADHLVLGCTHYPFLAHTIRRIIGTRNVEIVDPAPAIAERVAVLLQQYDTAAISSHQPQYRFYASGGEAYLQKLIKKSYLARELQGC